MLKMEEKMHTVLRFFYWETIIVVVRKSLRDKEDITN